MPSTYEFETRMMARALEKRVSALEKISETVSIEIGESPLLASTGAVVPNSVRTRLFDAMQRNDVRLRAAQIADEIVPEYRVTDQRSCTSAAARRWNAAHRAAEKALGEKSQ